MTNMRTPAGTIRRIVVPVTTYDELEKLRLELERNEEELASTKRVLDQIRAKQHRAPELQRKALARALREGEPAPEPENLDDQERKAMLEFEARQDLRDSITLEVAGVVESHRERWLTEAAAEIAQTRAELAAAVMLARATYESRLEPLLRRQMWIRGFPASKPHLRPPAATVQIAGSDVSVLSVLAELELAFADPEISEDAGVA